MIGRLFNRRPRPLPQVEEGRRVYAVGDIHGRLDLLDELLSMIEADISARPSPRVDVVMLGDLIDRGPDSAGVIRRAMTPPDWGNFTVLKGNHECAMLSALDGDISMARLWLRHGGNAALRSWGVDPRQFDDAPISELIGAARATIPAEERRWLIRLPLSVRIGDYYFAHAGLRPGVEVTAQSEQDTLWIREEFLNSTRDHGVVVVHGHSVTTEVEERPNRIGIDTGAYASGRLTAVALEGTERWYLQTGA